MASHVEVGCSWTVIIAYQHTESRPKGERTEEGGVCRKVQRWNAHADTRVRGANLSVWTPGTFDRQGISRLPTAYLLQGIYSWLLYSVRAVRVYRWYLMHGGIKSFSG